MKLQFNKTVLYSLFIVLLLPVSQVSARGTLNVHLTNISNTVLTPPLVALCKYRIEPFAEVGKPASLALEKLAEGGSTDMLVDILSQHHCNYVTFDDPVLQGQTITAALEGKRRDYLYMASMLLPTNDGFISVSGMRLRNIIRNGMIMLKSYDAGTEFNDESCANIPGPQCGGDGFNEAREDNDFIKPHPGLQGTGDVSSSIYNWGEPVAYIRVD